jgi:peptidoglycan/xylan/chitin deacetylase (PgdA/CDA1 family)
LVTSLKRLGVSALAGSLFPPLFGGLVREMAPVFMLHRFADPQRGVPGHDPRALHRNIRWLRQRGYRLLSIGDLVRALAEGDPAAADRAVVFTVDDGYHDFLRVGWPIFAELGCPVTVFLTTDFVEGKIWCWWDRVEFALAHTSRPSCAVDIEGRTETLGWTDAASLQVVVGHLVERLKRVPEAERLRVLDALARQSEVALPSSPPPSYAALTWEEVRRLEQQGVTFGAHSVTHPILSRTSPAQAEHEIQESWRRLRAETAAPVPVFCYPNGGPHDYGLREMRLLAPLGFSAAVATHRDYLTAGPFTAGQDLARYALPRFAWIDDHAELVQVVSGLERVKAFLRSVS